MIQGMSSTELEKVFDSNVDEQFQKDTFLLLKRVYAQSHKEVNARHQWSEAAVLLGHERRAQFDRDWRELAGKFSPHVLATVESNSVESFYFTRVQSGKVFMTASVASEMGHIRHADFRDTYARSAQGLLFEIHEPTQSDELFAVLIHKPNKNKRFPDFAKFVFPLARGGYHALKIDLFERFEIDRNYTIDEEDIDETMPELKKNSTDKRGFGG